MCGTVETITAAIAPLRREPESRGVRRSLVAAIALWVLVGLASPATPQLPPSQELYAAVRSAGGERLPGVMVTLSGQGPERVQQTDLEGKVRFIGLDPGSYLVRAELEGLGTDERTVEVWAGRGASVELELRAAISEEITVAAEAPLVDERHVTPGAVVTAIELEKIPTGNHPWALLRQTPGVFLDRVDVAGSDASDSSDHLAAVSDTDQNDILIEGISAHGSGLRYNSIYFDMNQYSEVQFTTGGSDVSQRTPGVAINLTMKRGANRARASVRGSLVDEDGYLGVLEQSEPAIGEDDLGPGQGPIEGTRIHRITDYGAEGGGMLVRNRAWLWGSYGNDDLDNIETDGEPTATALDNRAARVNVQASQRFALEGLWNGSVREQFGLGAATGERQPQALQDQKRDTNLYRARASGVLSESLVLDLAYGWSRSFEEWDSRAGGGPDGEEAQVDPQGRWTNQSRGVLIGETRTVHLDGTLFRRTAGIDHDFRFGGQLRHQSENGKWAWPGRDLVSDPGSGLVVAHRGSFSPNDRDQDSLWAQDTLSWGDLTVNVGLRWDVQEGRNLPGTIDAHRAFPEWLPEVVFEGQPALFTWDDLTPRLGVTYRLPAERETLLRASFSQFPDQLSRWHVNRTNVLGGSFVFFLYDNRCLGAPETCPWGGEPYTDQRVVYLFGLNYNPRDPAAISDAPNQNDPDLEAPLTDELILAIDRAVSPDFVLGLSVTGRRVHRVLEEWQLVAEPNGQLRPLRSDEWVPAGTVDGTVPGTDYAYSVPAYTRPTDLAYTGGTLMTNGSRERQYLGITFQATKRLSNRWMMKGFVSWTDSEWHVPDEYQRFASPNHDPAGGNRDGDLYSVPSTAGLEGDLVTLTSYRGVRWLESTWRVNLNGMVQIAPERPWGFNISGNVMAREGYPLPLQDRIQGEFVTPFIAVSDDLDQFRLDDLVMVDLRLEKEVQFTPDLLASFYLDGFNLTNDTSPQSRDVWLSNSTALWTYQTISPRVYRLGVRLNWR